jgi:hypothetical protein
LQLAFWRPKSLLQSEIDRGPPLLSGGNFPSPMSNLQAFSAFSFRKCHRPFHQIPSSRWVRPNSPGKKRTNHRPSSQALMDMGWVFSSPSQRTDDGSFATSRDMPCFANNVLCICARILLTSRRSISKQCTRDTGVTQTPGACFHPHDSECT